MKKKRQLQRSDVFWLLAVGLLVLLQFWWLPGDPGTPDDTYSNTIEGKRGFFETVKALSNANMLPTVRRESEKLIPDDISTLVILSPDRYPDQNEQRELTEFVRSGGSLMFAPNWANPDFMISALSINTSKKSFQSEDYVVTATAATPATQAPGQNAPADQPGSTSAGSPDLTAEAPNQMDSSSSAQKGSVNVAPRAGTDDEDKDKTKDLIEDAIRTQPGLQSSPVPTMPGEEDTYADISNLKTQSPLVSGSVAWRTRAEMLPGRLQPVVLVKTNEGTIQAATWNYGNGNVLLSASADVFSNRAMLDSSQAELAIRLLERLHSEHDDPAGTQIVVSEFLNASDSYRSTGVLMSPSLRSGTLQLLVVGLLAGWFGFHRFGPAKRSTSSERRSLTESATAVGNLFFRTQSGSEAVACYVDYFKAQLQALFGSTMRIDDHKTIARRTGLDLNEVSERIGSAISQSKIRSTTAPQAAAAIRDLSEILNRLTGGRE